MSTDADDTSPGNDPASTIDRGAVARRRTRLTAAAIAVVGLLLVIAHHDMPVLRNGMVYARTALNLWEHGLDIQTVGASSKLSYYKPLGFPLIAAVFVPLFGPNTATIVASYVGGLVLLFSCLGFFRHFNRRLGIDPRHTWLELVLVFFNPLVLYQFWSAYPDGLFAGLFVLFLWMFDRGIHDEQHAARWLALAYVALYGAVLVKQYGLVLLPLHVLYALVYVRPFIRNVLRPPRQRWSWVASLAVIGLLLGSAPFGWNPTLHVSLKGGGVTHYFDSLVSAFTDDDDGADDQDDDQQPQRFSRTHETRADLIRDNVNQLAVFAVTVFSLALLLTLTRRNLTASARGLLVTALAYTAGLMLYKYSWFNMRFYLPLTPVIAIAIVNGFSQARWRRLAVSLLGLTLVFNAVTSFNYNTRTGQRLFERFNEQLVPVSSLPRRFPYFTIDSLRLYWHIQRRVQFDFINETLPPNATLFFVHVYYRGVSEGIYTTPGLLVPGMFRPDINLEFFNRPEDVPWSREDCRAPDRPCYKYRATKFRRPRPEPRARRNNREPWYIDLAWGLYQVDPMLVGRHPSGTIMRPSRDASPH